MARLANLFLNINDNKNDYYLQIHFTYSIFGYNARHLKVLTAALTVMLKKIFFQIHWFLGITAGLILSIMGVTGAIYSYEQPIQKWINPASYTVKVEHTASLSPAEIYQHFQIAQPEIKINSITVTKVPGEASSINIVKQGARKGATLLLNPYTAEVLPAVKGKDFFQFIEQLHRNLTMGKIGKQITAACTLILLFFVLSGLYLRWPKKSSFKQWFLIKPKLKGRNFLWDLHAVVGTWVIIFYLLLACTGLYWSYDWWRNGMYKVLAVERPQATMQANSRSKNTDPSAAQSKDKNNTHHNLKPEQINLALAQTWTGFNNQIGRDYSSLTFSIPKKSDGKIELSFFDAIPQHERARNKATYNYQTAKIENIELYANKKLNEKIMSSILPVHRGSFFGPVYQFMVMLAALAMPLFFISGWMLYLKRRKQKKLTLAARNTSTTVKIDPNATPWLIVYASQTGVAEQLAWRTATSLQEVHQPVSVKAIQLLSAEDLQQNQQILFVASTYGTGAAPDLALNFEKKILNSRLDLSHLKYAVLALGSREYAESYCRFGHRIAAWLTQNGAQACFNTIEVNNSNNADIQRWNQALATVTQLNLSAMSIDKTFDQWQLLQRELLNPDSLGAPAFNIELQAQHTVTWQAGDIAEVQPGNSPERIQAFLTKYQIQADTQVDTVQQPIQQLLWNRDLTVAVESFTNLAHLLEQLPVLALREYSIASIPTQQILRLVVRQQSNPDGELGLGSGWLTQHLQVGDAVALRIRTNASFHLITDNRPIICIGNGTGIAGLMSLLHARTRLDYTENWLIFGERQQAHDYFYKNLIQAWQNTMMIKRLDLAFSRDQAEKVYVHHQLRQQADELKKWIAQNAVIYVCGSIQGMATDVEQALIDILGKDKVDELRQSGRYRRDVY